MKLFSMSKVFTAAVICLYSVSGFTQQQVPPKNQQVEGSIDLLNGAIFSCRAQVHTAGNPWPAVTKDPSNNLVYLPPDYADADTAAKFNSCLQKKTAPGGATDDDKATADCTKADQQISKMREDLDAKCEGAPKTDVSRAPSSLGRCIESSVACKEAFLGSNDSADSCATMSLDDIAKKGTGNVAKALTSYCEDQYPPACGPVSVADLHPRADDFASALKDEIKTAMDDKKTMDKDIKDNQDALDKANQELSELPAQFAKEVKTLEQTYEDNVKAIGEKLDNSLVGDYKKIAMDEADISAKTSARIDAESAVDDAKDQYNLACAAKAELEAAAKFPTGGMNVGTGGALVTRKARHQSYYLERFSFYKAQGTLCDGGKYASAQRNATKMSDQESNARAQLSRDQQQLQTDLQKVAMQKQGALAKELQDQLDRAKNLANDQQTTLIKKQTEIAKLNTEKAKLQAELKLINDKIAAIPTKQNCIQVLHQCATKAGGTRSKNSSSTANVEKAEEIAKKIKYTCASYAAKCNKTSSDSTSSDSDLAKPFKIKTMPNNYYKSPDCLEVYAAYEEGTKGSSSSGSSPKAPKPSGSSDNTKKPPGTK